MTNYLTISILPFFHSQEILAQHMATQTKVWPIRCKYNCGVAASETLRNSCYTKSALLLFCSFPLPHLLECGGCHLGA